MKTLKNSIQIAILFLLINPAFYAQNSLEGTIADWSNGEVPLVFNDYIAKEQFTMGTISSQGALTVQLDANFIETMKEASKKAKEKAPSGWEMKFNTVASTFGCSDEDNLSYENAGVIFPGLPDLEAVGADGATTYGYLYCSNSRELSTWFNNYGEGNIAKGYYLRWFFAENNASVKGSCNMPTYTGNDDENYMDATVYDLDLQKGWNIIKYAITETFTSQAGKITPSKTEVTRIDSIPDDAEWLLVTN
ncbi:hypothetical protein LX77_03364 [Gelidibacter algens]|uniref:Uncharacterized protein n=1 Tax=Gelidibacter algens TaxID=49280 RepID=A0A1A7R0E0_9FLAO|nr:hypothetical protein [Gelidibacter algens]OBX24993.1 hypothetical protein A9996_12405 [Gelidibacter algens]RAJ19843.1 hypothetical protein LX77_03364 [Gelidibacter algens]